MGTLSEFLQQGHDIAEFRVPVAGSYKSMSYAKALNANITGHFGVYFYIPTP